MDPFDDLFPEPVEDLSLAAVFGERQRTGGPSDSWAWSDQEAAWLRANYNDLGRGECARLLGRTVASVQGKATRLGITRDHRYSDRQNADFLADYRRLKPKATAKKYRITIQAAHSRAYRLGAPHDPKHIAWSTGDEQDLEKWLDGVCAILGRGRGAVVGKLAEFLRRDKCARQKTRRAA